MIMQIFNILIINASYKLCSTDTSLIYESYKKNLHTKSDETYT